MCQQRVLWSASIFILLTICSFLSKFNIYAAAALLNLPKPGDLFALYSSKNSIQLFKIDSTSDNPLPVGAPSRFLQTKFQTATIDSKNQLFYVLARNTSNEAIQVIGLSLTSGQIVKTATLPRVQRIHDPGLGQIALDAFTGDVYVVCPLHPSENYLNSLFKISFHDHPAKVTVLNDNNIYGVVNTAGQGAIVDSHQHLVISLGIPRDGNYLVVFDIHSGNVLKTVRDESNIQTLAYDPNTDKIIGVGYDVEKDRRTLVHLHSDTLKVKQIFDLLTDLIILLYGGSIDVLHRKLYCFLSMEKKPFRFEMVVVDIDRGRVMNETRVLPSIPESLIVYNQ